MSSDFLQYLVCTCKEKLKITCLLWAEPFMCYLWPWVKCIEILKTCLVTVGENEDDGDNGWLGTELVELKHTVPAPGFGECWRALKKVKPRHILFVSVSSHETVMQCLSYVSIYYIFLFPIHFVHQSGREIFRLFYNIHFVNWILCSINFTHCWSPYWTYW